MVAGAGAFQVKVPDMKSIEAFVAKFPDELRERMLKRALAKAARIMANDARKGARVSEKPRWGNPRGGRGGKKGKPLYLSIRSRALPTGRSTKVVHRTRTDKLSNLYSVAAEFGHNKVIFGTPRRDLGKVQGKRFWRPAIDKTQMQQRQAIITSLRADLGTIRKF
jgi:hypothetical protein